MPKGNRFLVLATIVLLVAALRVALIDVPNFAPIAALALFTATYFRSRVIGVLAPLVALLLGDIFLELFVPSYGFHNVMLFTYGGFLLVALIGLTLRNRVNVPRVALAGISGSLVFFIVSNFGVWAMGGYGPGLAGLALTYELAIPFYQWTLLGDLFFVTVLFGCYEFAKQRVPSLA